VVGRTLSQQKIRRRKKEPKTGKIQVNPKGHEKGGTTSLFQFWWGTGKEGGSARKRGLHLEGAWCLQMLTYVIKKKGSNSKG